MTDDTYIIVPAYMEGKIICTPIGDLQRSFSNIVVVNDGSTDDTLAVRRKLGVTPMTHLINIGQGAALQTGISYALRRDANAIVSLDADGQHQGHLGRPQTAAPGGRGFLEPDDASKTDQRAQRAAGDEPARGGVPGYQPVRHGACHRDHPAVPCRRHEEQGTSVTIHYTDHSRAKRQRSLNAVNVLPDLLIGRFFE